MSELTNIFGDIANAIRSKNGESNNYLPSEMSNAILDIPTGGGGDEYKNLCCDILAGTASNIVLNGVTDIANFKFMEDGMSTHNLVSINFPDVINTGYRSFENCRNLKDVYLPNANSLGNRSFYNCQNITNFYAPNVKFINDSCFDNAGKYEAMYNNTTWNAYFPEVENIRMSAFYNSGIGEVYLNNLSGSNIAGYAFAFCNHLETVYAPELTSLTQGYMFQYCTRLNNLYMPKLQQVGQYCFQGCTNLIDADFNNVTDIGRSFEGSGLVNAIFPNLVNISGGDAFYLCNNLTNVYMPNLVWMNYAYTFEMCPNLIDVTFENLYRLGNYTFTKCYNLTNATFYNLGQTNGTAFNGCNNLLKVDIYTPVMLNNEVFNKCDNFNTLILRGNTLSTIWANTFNNCPFNNGEANLYVPNDLIASYEAAPNWSTILAYPNVNILPIEGSPYDI